MQIHISHSRIGRTSRFTSVSFGSTHDFIILCNSHEVFPSPQNIGPRIEGSMTTIATDVVVFPCPNNREKFFKLDFVQDIEKTTTSVPIVVMLP